MGIKPTRDQRDEAVEYTRELLIRQLHTGQIKTALRAKFPWIVGARTCADYVTRARGIMLKEIGPSREVLRAEAVGVYRKIAQEKDASPLERVRAQERIDKLLGLESPVRTELSGPHGQPIAVTAVKREPIDFARLAELRRGLLGVPAPHSNGEPVHPAYAPPEAGAVPGANGG